MFDRVWSPNISRFGRALATSLACGYNVFYRSRPVWRNDTNSGLARWRHLTTTTKINIVFRVLFNIITLIVMKTRIVKDFGFCSQMTPAPETRHPKCVLGTQTGLLRFSTAWRVTITEINSSNAFSVVFEFWFQVQITWTWRRYVYVSDGSSWKDQHFFFSSFSYLS